MKSKRLGFALVLSALGLLVATGAAAANANDIKCQMTFNLAGWSVIYKTSSGSGTVTCDNGQSMKVKLDAKGGGLTVGKYKLTDGHGEFSHVTDINQILGTYATASAHAGVVNSGHVAAMTKGRVSLALSGNGEGWDIGAALSGFTIHKAD
ncbi:MAG: hypothetical protein ACREPZ_11260 [Rhodanobacteraceae bacterium]